VIFLLCIILIAFVDYTESRWGHCKLKHRAKWVKCADENHPCKIPDGIRKIRFGKDHTWRIKVASGSVDCTDTNFGDPLVGTVKECWYDDSFDYDEDHDGEWTLCAEENQDCKMLGRSIIRFGKGNGWLYEEAEGSVPCTDAHFGDPLYGTVKECDYLVETSKGTWKKCADENGKCAIPGNGVHSVKFGKNQSWHTKFASGTVDCTNTLFTDPLVGTVKECWYYTGNVLVKEGKGTWTHCANEGQECDHVGGAHTVRFGKGNNWVYQIEGGNVSCNDETFGDPLYGTVKECQQIVLDKKVMDD